MPYSSTTYTHHFPDKQTGHRPNGGKLISKQRPMKVTNSGASTKR